MPKGIRGFEKGNNYGTGRPPRNRSSLEVIKNRVLDALRRRISINKELKDVPTVELLKFAQYLMPKELSMELNATHHHEYQLTESDRSAVMGMLRAWAGDLVEAPKEQLSQPDPSAIDTTGRADEHTAEDVQQQNQQ